MRTTIIAVAVLLSVAFAPAFGQDVPNNPEPSSVLTAAPETKSATPVVVKVVEETQPAEGKKATEKKVPVPTGTTPAANAAIASEKAPTPIEEAAPPAALIEQAIETPLVEPSDAVAAAETMVKDDGLGAGAWITIVGGGIALTGAASWFTWRASALSDAEAAQQGSDQEAFNTAVNDLDTAEAVSMGLMIGGGAVALAGGIVWALSGDNKSPSEPITMLAPAPGGLSFAGTFW